MGPWLRPIGVVRTGLSTPEHSGGRSSTIGLNGSWSCGMPRARSRSFGPGYPTVLAAARIPGSLRSRPCGTGFAALTPVDAGREPRPSRPARGVPRAVHDGSLNGSLMEACWFLLVPGPQETRGEQSGKDWSQQWSLRGARDCSPTVPRRGNLSPPSRSPSHLIREGAAEGGRGEVTRSGATSGRQAPALNLASPTLDVTAGIRRFLGCWMGHSTMPRPPWRAC